MITLPARRQFSAKVMHCVIYLKGVETIAVERSRAHGGSDARSEARMLWRSACPTIAQHSLDTARHPEIEQVPAAYSPDRPTDMQVAAEGRLETRRAFRRVDAGNLAHQPGNSTNPNHQH